MSRGNVKGVLYVRHANLGPRRGVISLDGRRVAQRRDDCGENHLETDNCDCRLCGRDVLQRSSQPGVVWRCPVVSYDLRRRCLLGLRIPHIPGVPGENSERQSRPLQREPVARSGYAGWRGAGGASETTRAIAFMVRPPVGADHSTSSGSVPVGLPSASSVIFSTRASAWRNSSSQRRLSASPRS
jgi:hypothetical protein